LELFLTMLEFLYKPQEGISYDFIFYCYSLSCVICAILFAFDFYKVEVVKGFYVVFLPFIPCWIWSLVMKSAASRLQLKSKQD
jgi:hypothetical protein